MNKRVLGRTGLEVSELGLGGLFISRVGSEFGAARGAVLRAVERGVNYVDTAPTYANSEEVLGGILPEIDAPLVLSTKLGGRPEPFDAQDADALRQSMEESLRLLNRDRVDILMVHEPDRPGQFDWWSDKRRFIGPVTEVLAELKQEGIIRFTGLGGTTAYEIVPIIETGQFDVVLTAFNYSLLFREAANAVIPAAEAQNMGIVIGSPLQQGGLARRFDDAVRDGAPRLSPARRRQMVELYAFLDETGMSLPEMSLRFVLSNPAVSTVLMGARSVEEVDQNADSVEKGPLPAGMLERLDEIAAMVPFRPFGEPFGFAAAFAPEWSGPGRG